MGRGRAAGAPVPHGRVRPARTPERPGPARPRGATAVPAARSARPRLTSRAAILVIVLAVLAVSYASSLRAYLQQRDHIQDAQTRIADSEAQIAALEREKKRLDDPAYVEQQARARLGYVRPGETPFVVLRDGQPLEVESELGDPDEIETTVPPTWYENAWTTVLVAGHPPKRTDPLPEKLIDDPEGAPDAGEGE